MRLITLQNTTTRTLALAFAATALILAGCDGETGDTSTGESASLETATMGLSVVPKQSCFEDIQKAPAGCATEKALVKRAAGACGEANSTLEDYRFHEKCKEGGYAIVEYACCKDPLEPEVIEAPEPVQELSCWAGGVGGGDVCRSEASLELEAHKACAGKGYKLTNFGAGWPCMTKKGKGYSVAKFECCALVDDGPESIDEEILEEVEEAPCFTESMGDPSSCKTKATWEYYASSVCEDNDTELSLITGGKACKLKGQYGYRGVKFQCCPHADAGDCGSDDDVSKPKPKPTDDEETFKPKPVDTDDEENTKPKPKPVDTDDEETFKPKPVDTDDEDASKPKPKPTEDADSAKPLDTDDEETFKPKPLDTDDADSAKPLDNKGDGVTEPAEPTQYCFTETFGGDDWCAPESEWSAFSQKWCASPGYTLENFTTMGSCGKGTFHMVKMQCCGSFPLPTSVDDNK